MKLTEYMNFEQIKQLKIPFFVQHGTNSGTEILVQIPEAATNHIEVKLWACLHPVFIERWTQFPNTAYKKAIQEGAERLVACANALHGYNPEVWQDMLSFVDEIAKAGCNGCKTHDHAGETCLGCDASSLIKRAKSL